MHGRPLPGRALTTVPLSITWFGHSTFLLRSPGGVRLLFDPWIATNPACPASARRVGPVDLILVTHGHDDHIADVVPLARETGARVLAPYELAAWLERKGVRSVAGLNIGGSLEMRGVRITMVPALHSSSVREDGRLVAAGAPCGYVLGFEDGLVAYFAGDTALFGDMRLIAELHRPALAFLPIGGAYTMGPEQAAKACALLGVRQVVPMHYGTFPELAGRPEQLRALVEPSGVEVLALRP